MPEMGKRRVHVRSKSMFWGNTQDIVDDLDCTFSDHLPTINEINYHNDSFI